MTAARIPKPRAHIEIPVASTPASDRVRVRRKPERGHYEPSIIDRILDDAVVGMVGYVVNGQPFVTPTSVWRHDGRLYFHGSANSRMLDVVKHGDPVCITAILVDGFVLARTGFNHSMNYRSVMILGRAAVVSDSSEKLESLRTFVEHLFPGRWAGLRPPTEQELKATDVLSITLDEASAKIRAEGAHDTPKDTSWPVWAGVIPVRSVWGEPVPEPGIRPDLQPPSGSLGTGQTDRPVRKEP